MDDEMQRYRIEQANAWLSKVRKLVQSERALRQAADVQYEMADGLRGIDYSRDQVTVSQTPDAIPNAVIAREEAGDSLVTIAETAKERIAQAMRAIESMDDSTEASILIMYYIECFKLEKICGKIGCTMDGLAKMKRRALLNAYDIMPHSERDPQYSAI